MLVGMKPCKRRAKAFTNYIEEKYKVGLLIWQLGWVDLDLECSNILLGQLVAPVAAHQPGELPKSKST